MATTVQYASCVPKRLCVQRQVARRARVLRFSYNYVGILLS